MQMRVTDSEPIWTNLKKHRRIPCRPFATRRIFYGQFASEEEYNDFAAYRKDRAEKASFDLDAGQREIADLEEELTGLRRQKSLDESYKALRNSHIGSPVLRYPGGADGRRYGRPCHIRRQIFESFRKAFPGYECCRHGNR